MLGRDSEEVELTIPELVQEPLHQFDLPRVAVFSIKARRLESRSSGREIDMEQRSAIDRVASLERLLFLGFPYLRCKVCLMNSASISPMMSKHQLLTAFEVHLTTTLDMFFDLHFGSS